jgi:hypothetical protein
LQKAINVYNLREQMSNDAIKKERLEIQKLRMKLEELDKIIKQKQDRKVDIQPENSTHPDSTISK